VKPTLILVVLHNKIFFEKDLKKWICSNSICPNTLVFTVPPRHFLLDQSKATHKELNKDNRPPHEPQVSGHTYDSSQKTCIRREQPHQSQAGCYTRRSPMWQPAIHKLHHGSSTRSRNNLRYHRDRSLMVISMTKYIYSKLFPCSNHDNNNFSPAR
jgi:hypothetical protein